MRATAAQAAAAAVPPAAAPLRRWRHLRQLPHSSHPRPAQPVAELKFAHTDKEELAKAIATKPDRPTPAVAKKAAPTQADFTEE